MFLHPDFPRVPYRRENFGDSRTFKADIYRYYYLHEFSRFLGEKWEFGVQNRGRDGMMSTPVNPFLHLGFILMSVPILVKIDQENNATVRVRTDGQTYKRKPVL